MQQHVVKRTKWVANWQSPSYHFCNIIQKHFQAERKISKMISTGNGSDFQEFYSSNVLRTVSIVASVAEVTLVTPVILMIIWYERYRAGHVRTLINQASEFFSKIRVNPSLFLLIYFLFHNSIRNRYVIKKPYLFGFCWSQHPLILDFKTCLTMISKSLYLDFIVYLSLISAPAYQWFQHLLINDFSTCLTIISTPADQWFQHLFSRDIKTFYP